MSWSDFGYKLNISGNEFTLKRQTKLIQRTITAKTSIKVKYSGTDLVVSVFGLKLKTIELPLITLCKVKAFMIAMKT